MHLGEVCLMTRDAPRLAAFYRQLLSLPPQENHDRHQFIIAEEVSLAVWDDGTPISAVQTASLAFTTDNIDHEYHRLSALGVEIVQSPVKQPWGAVNMVLRDPDGRLVYLRQC